MRNLDFYSEIGSGSVLSLEVNNITGETYDIPCYNSTNCVDWHQGDRPQDEYYYFLGYGIARPIFSYRLISRSWPVAGTKSSCQVGIVATASVNVEMTTNPEIVSKAISPSMKLWRPDRQFRNTARQTGTVEAEIHSAAPAADPEAAVMAIGLARFILDQRSSSAPYMLPLRAGFPRGLHSPGHPHPHHLTVLRSICGPHNSPTSHVSFNHRSVIASPNSTVPDLSLPFTAVSLSLRPKYVSCPLHFASF